MAEMKFEEALKKLEKIVDELEKGDVSLDESLAKYEDGIRLARFCEKRLESAKKKVEILAKADDGSVELKPFDEKELEDGSSKQAPPKKKKKDEEELF